MDALPRFDRDPRSSGVMVYSRPGVAPGHYQYMRLSSIGEFKQSPNHSDMLISVQAIGDACTRFSRFAAGARRRRKQLCSPCADGLRRLLVGAAAEGCTRTRELRHVGANASVLPLPFTTRLLIIPRLRSRLLSVGLNVFEVERCLLALAVSRCGLQAVAPFRRLEGIKGLEQRRRKDVQPSSSNHIHTGSKMRSVLASFAGLLALVQSASALNMYDQCGVRRFVSLPILLSGADVPQGQGWTGGTNCPSNAACIYVSCPSTLSSAGR
jgi:hypothetical protein